jgi:hypothetical protein
MTKAPAKAAPRKSTKAPAKAIAPVPTAEPVIEGKIVTEPYIVFRGHTMFVTGLDEAQFAVLIEAERWMTTVQKKREALGITDATPPDDPRHAQAEKMWTISKNHLNRFMSVLGTLFVNEDDWDLIRDGMASKEITRAELFELPALVIAATREADELKPANRAAKRAKAATRAR